MIIIILFNLQIMQMRCRKVKHIWHVLMPLWLGVFFLFCFVFVCFWFVLFCFLLSQQGLKSAVMPVCRVDLERIGMPGQSITVEKILLLCFGPTINGVFGCSHSGITKCSCSQDKALGCGRMCFLKRSWSLGSETKHVFLCFREMGPRRDGNKLVSGVSWVQENTVI